jgi:hypothetical protein
MAWILILLAIACFGMTFLTKSVALGVLCMLLALAFVIVATMLLLSARVGSVARKAQILSPDELRGLREQAAARRENTATAGANASAGANAVSSTNERAPPTSS